MKRQLAVIALALCIITPNPMAQLVNGDFEGTFYTSGNDNVPTGWTPFETRTHETTIISSVADPGPSGGTTAMDFHRPNGGFDGDWTSIEQAVCIDMVGATSATLSLDVEPLAALALQKQATPTAIASPLVVIKTTS